MGKSINIENQLDSSLKIQANGILISWAIENVIKNSVIRIIIGLTIFAA